ncbi:MAG TPA: nucleotidyltransferase domain-containing protein [Terriglobia bacterium]|jgi:predicted nucleotidyltransferase
MLDTIQGVVDRVVEGYAPERIILFGSHASGTSREDSDLDLLIDLLRMFRCATTAIAV